MQAFCDERGVPLSARRAQEAAAAELYLDAQMRGFFRFSPFSHRRVSGFLPLLIHSSRCFLRSILQPATP